MTRVFTWLSLLVISACLLFLADRPSLSSPRHRRFVPVIRLGPSKTLNWAGYVAATDLKKPRKHSVTDVHGTWVVPAVASSGSLDTSSAIWVGIDGGFDHTVEQIGTEQDWTSGAPLYYVWFEMYPKRGYYLPTFPIQPGDVMSAEVQFIPKNQFILSIVNLTEDAAYSVTNKRSAQCTSAEWIVEAPFLHHILALADFGSVTFTNCSATIAGVAGAINDVSWLNQGVTMETRKTGVILAQPSGLTGDGMGFTVDWGQN
jgi:hypothetical protein